MWKNINSSEIAPKWQKLPQNGQRYFQIDPKMQ
jgi:hypothetical protein